MLSRGLSHRQIKYVCLLLSLVFLIVVKPMVPQLPGREGRLMDFGLALILVACVVVIGDSRKRAVIASAMVVLPLASVLFPMANSELVPVRSFMVVMFMLYSTVIVLIDVFDGSEVSGDKLIGSICAYLMIGICFAIIYLAIEFAEPGSFSFRGEPFTGATLEQLGEKHSDFFYFSFMTMTTVGYGDIAPLSSAGRAIVIAQAVFGQFYIALMVGRLLALHIDSRRKPRK